MMRRPSHIPFITAPLFLGALIVLACLPVQAGGSQLDVVPLAVETGSGSHTFRVEIARTPGEQAQGLMFRRKLAPGAGMLFVHESEQLLSMWMKNTYIPLDMLFIGSDGRIVHIAERTVPHSEAIISSGGPAIAVLELNGGTASRLKIKPGDVVKSSALAVRPSAR